MKNTSFLDPQIYVHFGGKKQTKNKTFFWPKKRLTFRSIFINFISIYSYNFIQN
jgi:hypothetical protein